eukprot:TRINITY_DN206_c0_g1_i12.p1 TRINITY_DN206_c0_g1~~TRINITY_DN206_c0_g1_i12.p1  ORF type:complete len:434 (+),score=134.11 TRINITY_DN206_c0_g1_i12:1816-3117(+)
MDKDSPAALFYNHIGTNLENQLNASDTLQSATLHSTIQILKTYLEFNPSASDRYLGVLTKAMHKLTRDHISSPNKDTEEQVATRPSGQGSSAANAAAAVNSASTTAKAKVVKDTATSLGVCLKVVTKRIGLLNQDQKKSFLTNLLNLLEKSPDQDLLFELVRIIGSWITGSSFNPSAHSAASSSSIPSTPSESTPIATPLEVNQNSSASSPAPSTQSDEVANGGSVLSNREKVQLLSKMVRFEQSNSVILHHSYLELVNYVYSKDPSFNSQELTALDHGFMTGLRSKETNLRNSFIRILDQSMSKNLLERFEYIIKNQNWENMGAAFWIKQVLDLLLCLSQGNKTFHSSKYYSSSKDKDVMMSDSQAIELTQLDPEASAAEKANYLRDKHGRFIEGIDGGTIGDLLNHFKELIHGDNELAFQTWILILLYITI